MKFNEEVTKQKIKIGKKEKDLTVDTRAKTSIGKDLIMKINAFEEKSWKASSDGIKTGFPMLDDAFFKGLVPGFYIIAADSNVGKSTLLTQMTHQMLDLNDNICILDFSLDDPMQDKISRIIGSWVRMDSNEVKFPKDVDDSVIERRKLGVCRLANAKDRYNIYDVNFGNSIERIEEEIETVKEEIGDTQLIVLIDSFHDLFIESEPSLTETQKFNKIAQWTADISIKNDIILICTAELKKTEKASNRPTLSDIRESIKIRYESKAIILLYNDVHYNGDSADVYYSQKNNPDEKFPVLEVHIVKNKISSWKGRLFYYMWASKGYLKECKIDAVKKYRSLI